MIMYQMAIQSTGILGLGQKIGVHVKILPRITSVLNALFALLIQGGAGKLKVLLSDMSHKM